MSDAETNRFNPRPLANSSGRTFGIRYPSPFFDIAQQFLPTNVHELHYWCRYYFLTNPIINVAVTKMAEYPVTSLIYDTEDANTQKLYKDFENHQNLRQFQVETGLDYFGYGISFTSLYFPFVKFLICKNCGTFHRAEKSRGLYKWHNMRFRLRCSKCSHDGFAEERDVYIRSPRDINLVRWNPENIEAKYNEANGKTRYYYKLPRSILNDVKIGDLDTIESLPIAYLEAIRTGKALIFSRDNLFVLKRPTIAQTNPGWGTPLIYPLLKDAFGLQIMKKAQESLLLEHVVPLRVIFPGSASGGSDQPYGTYNLVNWKSKIDSELNLWKRDNNYIPILPVNVGFQQWGGTARALILHQEFRLIAEQMLAGAGIPVEFVFGGLQWSGTNTSLRALENMFSGYNRQRHTLINDFILGKVAAYMQWPRVNARFDRFKMADDLQRSMFYLQLNQANKISDRRLMEEIGEDYDLELDRMDKEMKRSLQTQRKMQVASASVQGESQLVLGRYQAKVQALQMQAQAEVQQDLAQQGLAPDPAAAGAPPAGAPAPGGDPAAAPAEEAPVMGAENANVYGENAQDPNQQKMPVAVSGMTSQLRVGAGGLSLSHVAQRAASYVRVLAAEQGDEAKESEIQRISMANPQLGQMVRQLVEQGQGSQTNPLDAMKSPVPGGGSQKDPGRMIG